METEKFVDMAKIENVVVFMYENNGSVGVSQSLLQEDENGQYIEFPKQDIHTRFHIVNIFERHIIIKEEKKDEYEKDIDVLSAVWCFETPSNMWMDYKFKNEIPLALKQTMAKLFVPDNMTDNPNGRMCWFVNSLCGSSVPVKITTRDIEKGIVESELLIPSFPVDKQSEEWKTFRSTLKELDIKMVSKYRF